MKGGEKGKGERKRGKKNYFRTNDGAKYNQGNVDGGMSLSRARRKRVERGGRGGSFIEVFPRGSLSVSFLNR